jgi:hypothetical protein
MVSRAKVSTSKATDKPANGRRSTRVLPTSIPWDDDSVRDLLLQGYDPKAIAKRTGYPLRWVQAQPIPRIPLTRRVVQRRNGAA